MIKFEFKNSKDDIERYLQSGEQTQITPEILKITSEFTGTTLEKVGQIIAKVASFKNSKFNPEVFRKRTAEKIIKDGYVSGCTDSALLFVTLARASGIPAKYVETIDEDWLAGSGSDFIQGHIYSQFYEKETDDWHWADPMGRNIDIAPEASSRVIYKEGLDSWDIGLKDYESLRTSFNELRDTYKK